MVQPDAHAGYISWETFEANQRQLRDNARAHDTERRHGPAREGPALLQGLVLCGRCGERMTVRYGELGGRLVPHYSVQELAISHGVPLEPARSDRALYEVRGEAPSRLLRVRLRSS